jgi:hypothetical protein
MAEPTARLRSIFERLREQHYPTLPSEVVDRLAEIENEHLFTRDATERRREVRRLIEMHVRASEVEAASRAAATDTDPES